MPHGGGKAPRVRLHVVALHRVQLVGAVVAAHHVDVIPQGADAWVEVDVLYRDVKFNSYSCSLEPVR